MGKTEGRAEEMDAVKIMRPLYTDTGSGENVNQAQAVGLF